MIMRAEYCVGPELRYLSTLDMLSLFHRALRRSRLPFALSQGFNPHIKMTLGIALPVGLWSEKEYFDLDLTEDIAPDQFMGRLNAVCPPGLKILQASCLVEKAPSLMVYINACSYRFVYNRLPVPVEELAAMIMSREHWMIASRGKKKNQQKDLRKGIIKIEAFDDNEYSVFNIWASVNEPLNVRYDELKDLLQQAGASDNKLVDIYKTGNYHQSNSRLDSPLRADE